MGANQSKIFRQRRGRGRDRIRIRIRIRAPHDPGSTPANTARDIGIENQNSIVNTVTGDIVKIVNSNPTTNNVITNNYAAPAQEASTAIQSQISAALKERHAPMAAYDAQLGSGCMEGTRVLILDDIETWILNTKAQRIFWLAGMAGTGKSAIAWTICSRACASSKIILGGSYFCSRSAGSVAQRDVRSVVPTLAQLLARQSPEFSAALAEELARDPDVLHKQIRVQIEQLLCKPLHALKDSPAPILFVIDALDECSGLSTADSASEAESDQIVSEMLEALVAISRSEAKLPVKFLVTSRPVTHIRDTSVSDIAFSNVLRLHTVNKEQVAADIRLYITTKFSSSSKLRTQLTDHDADMLCRLCDGLFIVATTALKYTLGAGTDGAARRFKSLLQSSRDGLRTSAAAPLDNMYGIILQDAARVGEPEGDDLLETMKLLASLLSARMTLSVTGLSDLLCLESSNLRARLSRLHAVVNVPEDDSEPSLRPLHASFGDYLYGRAPSGLRISKSLGHEVLGRGSLRVMAERLHFNISRSNSSYQPNQATRPGTIALSLEYACLQWVHHVAATPVPSSFDEEIDVVFRTRFLFWLEVISVLGQVWRAAAILFLGATTVRLPELSQFFREANIFVTSSFEAIRRSAPHIYFSALPFADKESIVYKTFAPLCTGLISVQTLGIDQHGGRLIMTLAGHESYVHSVAYSSNNRLIGSGSNDGTVRIWDTCTGEETIPPLSVGSAVLSVAFAPNGNDLAAGAAGGDVCIWSVAAGRTSLRHLRGHSGSVHSVAFAPNGIHLASASSDNTVRLWRTNTGHQLGLLNGHESSVNAVAFAPNGATLASCSDDQTLRLWNVSTCQPAGEPLRGHRDEVLSVCFSPDGSRLASGSGDYRIKLWDIETRTCVATLGHHIATVRCVKISSNGRSMVSSSDDHNARLWDLCQDMSEASSIALPGHTHWVCSASFSPDDFYVATASNDHTIRIWDAAIGLKNSSPLPAHAHEIWTIAISPDDAFIVSGSYNRDIRIWDTRTGEQLLAPLLGHTESVCAVSVSFDGCLIASASWDETIRLWNAQTGEPIGEPLRGHTSGVYALSFSPGSRLLASGSFDKTVRIWDAATSLPYPIHPHSCAGDVYTVVFSSDSHLIAACDGTGCIYLWHAATGEPVCKPIQANNQAIYSIHFSPDGSQIVSGGEDYMLRVWDVITQQQLLLLEGHSYVVRSVAFSSDGKLICSGSDDRTVRLWDSSTGLPIATLHGHTEHVMSVAFTADGRSIVSGSVDRTIRVWDVDVACLQSSGDRNDHAAILSSSILRDEWLTGSSEELLVWLPAEYREYLQVHPCRIVIGKSRVSITVETSGWHHGEDWKLCWRGEA